MTDFIEPPEEDYKLPRLYVASDLRESDVIALDPPQAHYLKNVLRRHDGQKVRLFNGREGEWLGTLRELSKKAGAVELRARIRPQPQASGLLRLFFAPIKKARFDWLIEKAVELGATDLHPVLTHNTEIRKINRQRLERQILEAAEQCERLSIPRLHPLLGLQGALKERQLLQPGAEQFFACIERMEDAPALDSAWQGQQPGMEKKPRDCAVLIGPEGGFTREEKELLRTCAHVVPVSLGAQLLRCETAAAKALIILAGGR